MLENSKKKKKIKQVFSNILKQNWIKYFNALILLVQVVLAPDSYSISRLPHCGTSQYDGQQEATTCLIGSEWCMSVKCMCLCCVFASLKWLLICNGCLPMWNCRLDLEMLQWKCEKNAFVRLYVRLHKAKWQGKMRKIISALFTFAKGFSYAP